MGDALRNAYGSARCDLTDLLVSDCAHCRGVDEPAARRLFAERGPWFPARFPGACSYCGTDFEAGEHIRADGDGGWLGQCCGEGDDG